MRKVYLASAFGARQTLIDHAAHLRREGIEVTARWLEEVFENDAAIPSDTVRRYIALDDINDVRRSDTVVIFTGLTSSTGGYHFEHGLAAGLGKEIVLVGPRRKVFDYVAYDQHYKDFEDFFFGWVLDGKI